MRMTTMVKKLKTKRLEWTELAQLQLSVRRLDDFLRELYLLLRRYEVLTNPVNVWSIRARRRGRWAGKASIKGGASRRKSRAA